MKIERAFSLSRTEIFKAALNLVPSANTMIRAEGERRNIMSKQNIAFIRAMNGFGSYRHILGLQTIHCDHEGRQIGEQADVLRPIKKAIEYCGGGWLASWLPSRSCSRRNLERARAAHHYEFQNFKRTVERFRTGDIKSYSERETMAYHGAD